MPAMPFAPRAGSQCVYHFFVSFTIYRKWSDSARGKSSILSLFYDIFSICYRETNGIHIIKVHKHKKEDSHGFLFHKE